MSQESVHSINVELERPGSALSAIQNALVTIAERKQFSRRMNRGIDTIPSVAMDALCRYRWPGNIRELQNVIERTVIISPGPTFNLDFADMKFPKATRPKKTPATPKSPTD